VLVAKGARRRGREAGGAGSRAFWLAWSLAGLSLAIFLASGAFYLLVPSAQSPGNLFTVGAVGDVLGFVSFLAFPLVGALIASKRPNNPIGWMCLVVGLFWMLMTLTEVYSAYGLAKPGSVPFPVTIHALLYSWLWVPTVGLLGIYMILLFPDGRLPSRRWRPLAWLSATVIVAESIAVFLTPGPLEGLREAQNPFGLEGQSWLLTVGWVVLPLIPLCMVASAASLVLRYRRSEGEVREQIKWLAFSASITGAVYLGIMSAGVIDWLLSAPGTPSDLGTQTWWGALLEDVMLLSFCGIPVAIGFAILKYRLYDIAILINRALVYGSLTAMLVLLYVGGVVSLQYAFRLLTGQGSTLAVVASTLAIAALFNPLRSRVQSLVDRRFYRSKYDAMKTLEAFSAKLRDETDLDRLGQEMVGVVRETMNPAHASLWIRTDIEAGRGADRREAP
jgi:hypothetical protein